MRYINSVNEINLPNEYIEFLLYFLRRISFLPCVDRVILFGSCAREDVHTGSDVDLLIIGDNVTNDDEIYIYLECLPLWNSGLYLESDLLVSDHNNYEQHKLTPGYVQRWIELEGIDLSHIMKNYRIMEVS